MRFFKNAIPYIVATLFVLITTTVTLLQTDFAQGQKVTETPVAQANPVAQATEAPAPASEQPAMEHTQMAQAQPTQSELQPSDVLVQSQVTPIPDISFTLQTGIAEGKLVFIGVGGEIDGVVNPTLKVEPNAVVQITLLNGDGAHHDIALPDFNAKSELITGQGTSSTFVFKADKEGQFTYLCTVPGHQQAGMQGLIEVGEVEQLAQDLPSVVRDPSDVPAPIGQREPMTHNITLETKEVLARLADGSSFRFWTFDGTVPGPMLRVRVGDTVNVSLKNAADSTMIHSVDFHAVTGPGGGAVATQTQPGQSTSFTFKAINPGLYVYHCATPMVAHHIANGMYGLILVEPEEGLPEVDHEFYVMQGEIYTQEAFGQHGENGFSVEKLLNEDPEYFVFNGAVGGLTTEKPMHARVGDTVRLFFGVGGPNFTSSFHVIGEIFDRVFDQSSLTANPLTDVQTTTVAPGGATMVEFKLEVPGRYILVDHALSRLERGLVGFLMAEGDENPEIFRGEITAGSGH
jgi:nitrite reductase (NO-forming)